MPDQGAAGGTRKPGGAGRMKGHSGAEGALSESETDGSKDRGGVWGSVAGSQDRGSSRQGHAGDWKPHSESAVLQEDG
ncbi:hypothetical protein DPX16_21001 [Anabarilius grahami]|uniref:Uncharacterized protein n=1 Tax=Anabarilius grahami TaxID=495550 RepID=A0A3N0YX62_ANAGA|nr:hypothetical protein DPX16_21001 [Anabarilius grahami]